MHSAWVSVVLCPVCCVAPEAEGAAASTDPHPTLRKIPGIPEDSCSKRLNTCLKSRCLEAAGASTKTLTRPGTLQKTPSCRHRAGPRKYCIPHSPSFMGLRIVESDLLFSS